MAAWRKAVWPVLGPLSAFRLIDALVLMQRELLVGQRLCVAAPCIVVEDPAAEGRGQNSRQYALALLVAPAVPEPEERGGEMAEPLACAYDSI